MGYESKLMARIQKYAPNVALILSITFIEVINVTLMVIEVARDLV